MEPHHLDQLFNEKLKDIDLQLLKLTPGRRTTLSKALCEGSADLAFTSNDVKNGGMFMVTTVYIGNYYVCQTALFHVEPIINHKYYQLC